MRTKLQEKTESATIINGVVLTQTALERLASMQDNENENLDNCRETLADAICFIARNIGSGDDLAAMQDLIADLSYIRDYFNDFRKP